jgi:iron complex outermembrane recepter protein
MMFAQWSHGWRLVVSGGALALVGPITIAAEFSSDQLESSNIPEIVVTAQKRAERAQDVPISMSVLVGNDLDKSTYEGVTEVLNAVPGMAAVANQFQSAGTFLEVRGVTGYNAGASTVGYYIDSVPFGMMRLVLVPDANIYDLKQIEVLRGPQGTLYGANSENGVVRILTNDPDMSNVDFKARSMVSTTQYGGANYSGDMAVNLPIIADKLAARLVAGDGHESGWINGPLGNHLNDGDISNVRLKIAARPTDALTIELSAWHSQSNYNAPSLADGSRQNDAQHPQPNDSRFNAYGAQLNYDLSLGLLSSVTSYVDYANPSTLDAGALGAPINYVTILTSKVFSEEINLTSRLDGPWRWSVGAMYRDDRDTNSTSTTTFPSLQITRYFDFTDSSKSSAAYGDVGKRFFLDKFQWTLGVRYFHDDEGTKANGPLPGFNVPLGLVSATSTATTPRAVLNWFPTKDITGYISYSQGFRSGIPQDEAVGSIIKNFPPLKPDKLTNYEAGVKGTFWDHRVSYDAAVFYIVWHDVQQSINVIISDTAEFTALLNDGSASGEGAEFAIRAQPLEPLSVGASFSWNNLHFNQTVLSGGNVVFAEGARPNGSPEYTAGASAEYKFPLSNSGVEGVLAVAGNYISSLNTTTLGLKAVGGNSLVLAQGNFALRFPSHWTLGLFVNNANDYQGTQFPFPGVQPWDTRIRPRTYGVRVDYHLR